MTNEENLLQVMNLNVNYLGLIFYRPSKRFVNDLALSNKFYELLQSKKCQLVGVFVDESLDEIVKVVEHYKLNVVQLHGDESVDFIKHLRNRLKNIQIWKVLSVACANDLEASQVYHDHIDTLLLDTSTPLKGGSGQKFDWSLLNRWRMPMKFILSGGIDLDDTKTILELNNNNPYLVGVDLNSRFETEPGLKSVEKVEKFINTLKGN